MVSILGILGEIVEGRSRVFSIIFVFVVMLIFCGLRNGVGNDYLEYSRNFERISRYELSFSDQRFEPIVYCLAFAMRSLDNKTLYLMFVFSAITLFFLFKALLKYRIFLEGLFLYIALGFMFMMNDQVRQGMALSVFLYALRFVESRDLIRYCLSLCLGALFHYTIILMLPIFFVTDVKLSRFFTVPTLLITFIVYKLGVFYELLFNIIRLLPYYGRVYASYLESSFIRNEGKGFGILFLFLISLFVVYAFDNDKYHRIKNTFILGVVIMFMSIGFMPVQRLSLYLFSTIIVLLGVYLRDRRYSLVWGCLLFILGMYYSITVLFDLDKYGAVPYSMTIFS